jgi:hypothetical protein
MEKFKMKKSNIQILAVVVVMVLVSLACGFSASTANIKDAYMSADEAGTQKTTEFAQDAVLYAVVTLANAPDDTTLKAVWYAVNAQDTEPNYKIDEVTTTTGDGVVPFTLTNDNLWPTGTYKVELYLNDKLEKTLDFEVK